MVVMGTPLCGANTHTIGAKREGVTGLRARSERAWRRGAKALREQPPELGQQQAQGRPLVQAELRAEDARVEADELAIGRVGEKPSHGGKRERRALPQLPPRYG